MTDLFSAELRTSFRITFNANGILIRHSHWSLGEIAKKKCQQSQNWNEILSKNLYVWYISIIDLCLQQFYHAFQEHAFCNLDQ